MGVLTGKMLKPLAITGVVLLLLLLAIMGCLLILEVSREQISSQREILHFNDEDAWEPGNVKAIERWVNDMAGELDQRFYLTHVHLEGLFIPSAVDINRLLFDFSAPYSPPLHWKILHPDFRWAKTFTIVANIDGGFVESAVVSTQGAEYRGGYPFTLEPLVPKANLDIDLAVLEDAVLQYCVERGFKRSARFWVVPPRDGRVACAVHIDSFDAKFWVQDGKILTGAPIQDE